MTIPIKPRKLVTVSDHKFAARCPQVRVVIIDDDAELLSALAALFEMEGYACETYASALTYLQVLNDNQPCFPDPNRVLCDVKMPELDGLALQNRLAKLGDTPFLLMSGSSGMHVVANAFRAGAIDFLVKPVDADILLAAITKALAISKERQNKRERESNLTANIASLTKRERDIARRVAAGQSNPMIAAAFGIGLSTVKLHRQRAMEKIGASGIADLVRIAGEGGM